MTSQALGLHIPVDESRHVFGWLHVPPSDVEARATGVVLCPPVGEEYMMSHRSLRNLATRLAKAGFHTLRLDYDGMGNSSGDDRDPHRVAAWLASIRGAIGAIEERSGVSQVSLFGLRFGGTLALAAAEGRSDVASLVVYGAVPSGKRLAREIRAFSLLGEKGESEGVEWAGFLFSNETMSALAGVDPTTCPAPRALVVHRDDISGDDKIAERLRKAGVIVDEIKPPGFKAMMTPPHVAVFPDAAWTAVTDWLDRAHPTRSRGVIHPSAPRKPAAVARGVQEEIIHFGEGLTGLVTTPNEGARADAAVLFLNTGANHHVGPNRMYVRFARALAARGYTSLRYDLSTIGEGGSPSELPTLSHLYSETAIEEARQAFASLRERGHENVVLFGLCSGAFQAFHVALREVAGVAGIVLVNVQILERRAGETLDDNRSRNFTDVQRYREGMFDPARWKKVLRGQVDLKRAAKMILKRIRLRAEVAAGRLTMIFKGEDAILANVRTLVMDRGIETMLVYATGDPGVDYLEDHVGPLLPKLREQKNFSIVMLDGVDHVFTPLWSQDRLGELLVSYMETHHPAALSERRPEERRAYA